MTANTDATGPNSIDQARPFGAHERLRWWVPIVLTVVIVIATYGLQILFGIAASMIEVGALGKDPTDLTLTPLTYLAMNLAIIAIAPIALLVFSKATRSPWRSALALGRGLDRRRLAVYLGAFAVLMVATNALVQLINPSPLSAFAITGTTVALLIVVLLTTPLQAAAEEITFRGVLTTAYGSWLRAARPALVLGISLSTALFAVLHTSTDPWMIGHYLGLGASTAIMATIARGLEPAIAFHVVSNVFAMGIGALFSNGGGIGQDRSAGVGGPYMLLFIAAQALAVTTVWHFERRRTAAGRPSQAAAAHKPDPADRTR